MSNYIERLTALYNERDDIDTRIEAVKVACVKAEHPLSIGDVVVANCCHVGKLFLVDMVGLAPTTTYFEFEASGWLIDQDGIPLNHRGFWTKEIKNETTILG